MVISFLGSGEGRCQFFRCKICANGPIELKIGYDLDVCFLSGLLYWWGLYWPRAWWKPRNPGARIADFRDSKADTSDSGVLYDPTSVPKTTKCISG